VSALDSRSDPCAFFERRLLVLTGKGGVGKSALSAALGLAALAHGKRVLLAEVRAPRRLPRLLGAEVDADGLRTLRPGLQWINLRPEDALEIYAMRLLKLRTVYRAVFEQRLVQGFLRAVPSLAEILMLGHLRALAEESGCDLIVMDAPSTGPGAMLLEAPQAVVETAPLGPLRDGAEWIQRLLTDPASSAILLVALPEELPVQEALELHHRLRRGGFPQAAALLNRMLPDPFPPGSQAVLERLGDSLQGHDLVASARSYLRRLELQRAYLDRLRAGLELPVITLPEVAHGAFGLAAVETLAQVLGQALSPRAGGAP
jgi:anion-transporting  ArsA/GET3 family ATPase